MPRPAAGATAANQQLDQQSRALVRDVLEAPAEDQRREAFDRLWDLLQGRVRGKLRRDWGRQYPEGNDFVDVVAALVQSKLWNGCLRDYRRTCSVASYLHRIAKTTAIDEHRKRKKDRLEPVGGGPADDADADGDGDCWARLGVRQDSTPETELLRAEQDRQEGDEASEMDRRADAAAHALYDALRALSTQSPKTAKWAQALRLRYFESGAHPRIDDVAIAMGVSWRSAHRYLSSGLEALARALDAFGVKDLDALCRWAADRDSTSGLPRN